MGDRGNIVMEESDGKRVYFYSHWSGSELFKILQNALTTGKSRWDDEQYLARVIFCELVKDDDGITGYGISTYMGDNEHPVFVVNSNKQQVRVEESKNGRSGPWSFEEFLQFKDDPRHVSEEFDDEENS